MMNFSRQSDIEEEDVVGGSNVSAYPVMPKLYPAVEPRSADGLTPGEELRAVGNGRGCSPGDINCSPIQQVMHGHPSRDVSAQQHGRRRELVDVTNGAQRGVEVKKVFGQHVKKTFDYSGTPRKQLLET